LCKIHSFIIHTFHTLILCLENTFDIRIYRKIWNSCVIRSFINSYFICQHICLCVKCVFNILYSYVKCTNLWMNKLCTIFIINLSHVKFMTTPQKLELFSKMQKERKIAWGPLKPYLKKLEVKVSPLLKIRQNNN